MKYSTVEQDETIRETQDEEGHTYWKICFGAQEKEARVRLEVTAEDGTRKDYYLTLEITDKTAPVLKKSVQAGYLQVRHLWYIRQVKEDSVITVS